MKVYVDGSFYKGSGIGRYYSNLVKLLAEETEFDILTTVPEKRKGDWVREFNEYKNVIPIFTEHERFSTKGFLERGRILKNLQNECQVFWFPHVNLPSYIPNNTVVTVHDVCPLTSWWDRNLIDRLLFIQLLRRAIKKAKLIVVPSNFTKEELSTRFPRVEGKVRVIYNFIDDEFLHRCSDKKGAIVEEDYILFVGNRKRHKNLRNLVLAYDMVKDRIGCKLVIAGSRDKEVSKDEIDELIEERGLKDLIIQFDSPSDDVLINLYQNAKLFVFPSFYEGFGFPPLEALACGCPVIASNIPVLKEILGEEVACFDPHSVSDIAVKIKDFCENSSARESVLKIRSEKLKHFSKNMMKDLYISILHQAAG